MCIFAIDMELKYDAIETLIKSVLTDISQKGYSSVQPFSIGKYKKLATRDQLYLKVKETKRQGRIAHHLCIAAAMPPFRTSWLYLASPFTLQI